MPDIVPDQEGSPVTQGNHMEIALVPDSGHFLQLRNSDWELKFEASLDYFHITFAVVFTAATKVNQAFAFTARTFTQVRNNASRCSNGRSARRGLRHRGLQSSFRQEEIKNPRQCFEMFQSNQSLLDASHWQRNGVSWSLKKLACKAMLYYPQCCGYQKQRSS